MTYNLPLAAVRRRYGRRTLVLALPALLLANAILVAALPPPLRGGGLVIVALVLAASVVTGLSSLLWTWIMAWPVERKRLAAAEPVQRVEQLPVARDHTGAQLAMLILGGLLVAATLWAVVSYLGFAGAPMFWIAVGIANLEKARRLERLEREQNVVYYEAPRGKRSGLFVVPLPSA